jgi:glycosyltransferase involved in cell wall biosynthesis
MTSLANTGYGIAGKYIIKELIKKEIGITLFPYGPGTFDSQEEAQLFYKLQYQFKPFDYVAPCVNIWHQFDLAKHIGRGQYLAWPIFELNKFTDIEKNHLGFPDNLIVCSKWAKSIIKNLCPSQLVDVVPLGVDPSIFYPYEPQRDHLNTLVRDNPDQYIFFNIGKWEKRKGHDILPKLFCKAFKPSDNVKLVLVPYNPFLSEEETKWWHSLYNKCKLHDKITIIPQVGPHNRIADIINACSCGIFPSKGEGWNMELLEAMACGKRVITTNYSGHTEYCNENNSCLVECQELEVAYDGKWFKGQGEWMEIEYDQEEQFIEHMRHCYTSVRFNKEGLDTARKFTWKNSTEKLLKIIK